MCYMYLYKLYVNYIYVCICYKLCFSVKLILWESYLISLSHDSKFLSFHWMLVALTFTNIYQLAAYCGTKVYYPPQNHQKMKPKIIMAS